MSSLEFIPAYLAAVLRVAGLFMFAPLLGSTRIPRRVKGLLAVVLAVSVLPAVPTPVAWPTSVWELTAAIAGELAFGLAMGLALSLTFVAAQAAGELIGQQLGFQLGQIVDPQSGAGASPTADVYYWLTLVAFLMLGGHLAMVRGLYDSFAAVPPLTAGLDRPLFDLLTAMLASATGLALQLAMPVFVALLVVDVAMGCLGKTMPQMNLMTAGLTLRAAVGMGVVALGLSLGWNALEESLSDAIGLARWTWSGRAVTDLDTLPQGGG